VPVPRTTTDVERSLAFLAATRAACADRVDEVPFGRVVRTPALPLVWSLNAVEVAAGAGVEPAELRHHVPDVPRPSIFFEAPGDAVPGWSRENELVMVLERAPEAPAADLVRAGTRDEIRALQHSWLVEDYASHGAEAIEQLVTFMERQWEARPTRAFVSRDANAMTLLWSDGATAQVEDVYTRPDARMRGHARALVSHAAAVAAAEGHETVFIVADDDDTPKDLYARLGFEPAHRCVRCIAPAVAQLS
jgi:GNAT superfamily N-acetyltransferase